jgi:gliding motility-associated-like protein
MKVIIATIFFLTSLFSFSQNEGNIWYFGENAGVDFNSGAPVALTDGEIYTMEGCATICDNTGSLLFYTDGITIWNKNHVVMPNGTGLMGDYSSSQSSIIVKKPYSSTIYYVFTVDAYAGSDGLRYSEIDMSLQSGLGDVNANKNILIVTPTSEKITAIKHQNNIDFWIVTHLDGSDAFHSYLLNSSGLNMTPVVSNVGTNVSPYIPNSGNTNPLTVAGCIKASLDGSLVAVAHKGMDIAELFNFDNSTGLLSNPITLNVDDPYGVEFSPNGNLLYISQATSTSVYSNIYQYNLLAGSVSNIISSQVTIATPGASGGTLQLAPDNKIYFSRYWASYLGVINNPDIIGALCNFVNNGFYLDGNLLRLGLPTFFNSIFTIPPNSFTYTNICFGDSTVFTPDSILVDSVNWNFGDVNSGMNNTSTNIEPNHVFSDTGTFIVTLYSYLDGVTDIFTDTLFINPLPIVSLNHDTTLCAGTTNYLLDAGNPGSTYLWNDNSVNQTLSVTQTGIYSVTVTNAGNCSAVDSIIICFGTFTSNTVITDVSCNGLSDGAIDLTITSGQAPYAYAWNNSETTEDINGLIANDYTVSVTDSIGCVSTQTYTVNEPQILTVSGTVTNLNCYQDNTGAINITPNGGNGGFSYIWSNAQTTEDLTNIAAAVYTVTVSDANNCTATYNDTVTQPTQIVTSITPTNLLCYGDIDGQADLTVSGGTLGYTYLWSNGQTIQDATNLTGTTYIVTITDANNCIATNSVTITEIGTPLVATLTQTTLLCYGDNNAEIQAIPNGGSPDYYYLWNSGQTTSTITNISSGNYYVTITDNNDCQIIESAEISQPEELFISLPNDFYICLNPEETITASATGGTPNYSYNWSTNQTTETITVSPTQTTTYTVIVTDANNCTLTNDITVNVYSPLQIQTHANHDTVCLGEAVLLAATYQGGSGVPYHLYIDGQSTSLPINVYPTHGQTYTVSIEDLCGNKATDSYTLYNYPVPPIAFSSDPTNGCVPLEVQFNENSNCEGCSYVWNFDDINHVNLSIAKNPVHVFEEPGNYDITVSVTNKYGCVNHKTITDMINVYPKPNADFMANPEIASIIKPLINFHNQTSGAVEYHWSFGDGNSSNYINPEHQYQQIGSYMVELVAVSINECKDTVHYTVKIKDEFTFYAPTAFSPDNDGINDYFKVFGNGIDNNNFKLLIYDRWGEPIFESDDINQGWDGIAKQGNDIVQTGSYTWTCIFKDDNGVLHEEAGSVTVIR